MQDKSVDGIIYPSFMQDALVWNWLELQELWTDSLLEKDIQLHY